METELQACRIVKDLPEYNIVKSSGNNDDLQHVKDIFLFHGTDRKFQNLQWLHQRNLNNTNILFFAIHKNTKEISAVLGAIPVNLIYKQQIILSIQLIDALTHNDHRYKKLLYSLVNCIEEYAKAHNYQLIYGIPNEQSEHTFVNKCNFKNFGQVPFLIKPISISYALKKIFGKKTTNDHEGFNCKIHCPQKVFLKDGCYIKSINKFEKDYDDLWSKVSTRILIGINRNREYMNWRYIDKPGEYYSRYGLYEKGVLTGIVIFTLKNKHDGRIGYLMEVLFDPENEYAGNKLLKFCSKVLKENKADLILAWCFSHSFNYFCHRKAGFYKFPERLRPQKLGIIVKSLNLIPAEDIHNNKNWFFSYSDSDTV